MRNTDMRLSNNLLQEQQHAKRTCDVWDIPGRIHGAVQCSRTMTQPVSRKTWSTHQEKQGPSLMLWPPAQELDQQAPGQGTVNTESSRTLSHSQASGWVLQGLLCLGPPPNTWETSECLLPLSATKLSHLGLLALAMASERCQDSLPTLLSEANTYTSSEPV